MFFQLLCRNDRFFNFDENNNLLRLEHVLRFIFIGSLVFQFPDQMKIDNLFSRYYEPLFSTGLQALMNFGIRDDLLRLKLKYATNYNRD